MNLTTEAAPHADDDWVPEACTLPTTEQPVRVREFDDLFANSLRAIEHLSPTVLHLSIDASARGIAADLAARESGCCSFFTFTFGSVEGEELGLDVSVPDEHADVLEALATRAASASGLRV